MCDVSLRGLVLLAALTAGLFAWAPSLASASSNTPPVNLQLGTIGYISLSMPRSAVNAQYKNISYSSCAAGDCSSPHTNTATYFTGHGAAYVHFAQG